jgi:two-component system, OmpR family, osmolarity sensor histidine kinase EnvZ
MQWLKKILLLFNIVSLLKASLPQSLFGRALLILVLPTILVQIVAVVLFYERHWSSVQRHLSSSLAGEVALIMDRVITTQGEKRNDYLMRYAKIMNMDIAILPPPLHQATPQEMERFAAYIHELNQRLGLNFSVFESSKGEIVRTQILWQHEMIQIDVGVKRLESATTYIFVSWLISSAFLLTLIAIMFLRNQIRPIKRLAEVAQRFGMGQDVSNYRPSGAQEVRQAGKAFITMRARILRQINTRTAMLTGISHDLRTPLTRLKLQLAMLPAPTDYSDEITAMQDDIKEMEGMLNEYLEFARGNDEDLPTEEVNITELLQATAESFINMGANVSYDLPSNVMVVVRPNQIKRVVENIIGNALKYGGGVAHLNMQTQPSWLHIMVEDEGQGIAEDYMEDVFRPFMRLEESRNSQTGGVGLGLSIARDIVQAHGGKILLKNRYSANGEVCGLMVDIILPMTN